MATQRPLTSFKCLTFDCYGTLIDWEGGIWKALSPLNEQLPQGHELRDNRYGMLKKILSHEMTVQKSKPNALYSAVLAEAYGNLAKELGLKASEEDQTKYGQSVGDWPVFPDTIEALNRLHKHYKLVILSNVDRESFGRTLQKQFPGFSFDAIYTAQDIGSYKPNLQNFHYLIEHCDKDLGVKKEDIIHTAQSLAHDHVSANEVGLVSAWIERGKDQEVKSVMGDPTGELEAKVNLTWHFASMGEMADAVDAE
jgi:2-haloalkanoic acid dehalogenase type II